MSFWCHHLNWIAFKSTVISFSFINNKSPMKVVVLCAFLLVCSLSFTISNIVTDDGRVKVDFYYESLCPYCQQFMERSLKVASQTKVNLLLKFKGFLENLWFQSLSIWKCKKSQKRNQLEFHMSTWRARMSRKCYRGMYS